MRSTLVSTILLVFTVVLSAEVLAEQLPSLQNYDIRLAADKASVEQLAVHREAVGVTGRRAQNDDALMQDQRAALRAAVPGLRFLDSQETGAVEVISVVRGSARLTGPSRAPRDQIARTFVEQNSYLFGLTPAQAVSLEIDANYQNPAGNLAWVRLQQKIHGLNVFRGTMTLAFSPKGEIGRTTGQLAAGVSEDLVAPSPRYSAAEGVAASAHSLGLEMSTGDLVPREGVLPTSRYAEFERGRFDSEIKAELIYFPLGRGAVELAWLTTLQGQDDSYMVVVSAEDGTLFFRKNLTESSSSLRGPPVGDSYTYHVYSSTSPSVMSPGPIVNTDAGTGSFQSRTGETVTSLAANGDPWKTGNTDVTDGNNVEAGLDVVGPDGVDAPTATSDAAGNVFNYAYNPAPGGGAPPGDEPTLASYRSGAVVNLFYWVNRFHDLTYGLGFTEAAFNFQNDNYGRGGSGGDRIRGEVQDSSGTNNANFSTPADGDRGRMQMFRWTLTTPGRDGSLDADIMFHELTHGLSNRLHGNATGLSSNMPRMMGEGWSDFFAQSLLSQPTDPVEGVYALSGWTTTGLAPAGLSPYYYGIRGFPKAVMSFTGGPSNLPHNPLTFADIDITQLDFSDGAYPRLVAPHLSVAGDQVHAGGEIWSSALWEARGMLINRLGHIAGNQLMLQVVTDGMKLSPLNPTFLDARDAILDADCIANAGANEADLLSGFALRGMGFGAEVVVAGTGGGTARVVESFSGPNEVPLDDLLLTVAACGSGSVSADSAIPNPGETVTYSVTLANPFCGTSVTGVSAMIVGGSPVDFGTLLPGGTTTRDLSFTIPSDAVCGDVLVGELRVNSDIGNSSELFDLQVGPNVVLEAEFSAAQTMDFPAGQPGVTAGPADPYPVMLNVAGIDHVSQPVTGITMSLDAVNHTWVGDLDIMLEAPTGETMIVMSDSWNASNSTDTIVTSLKFDDRAVDSAPNSGLPPATTPAAPAIYKPTNHGAGDPFDAPAPAVLGDPANGDTFASVFAGIDPNGDWKLWIDDDAGGDVGTLDVGWRIGILQQEEAVCEICTAGDIFSDGFETGNTSAWSSTSPP